jgi:hypothetical protein
MIKKLLSLSLITFASCFLNAQSFNLVYEFSSVTASTGVVDPSPTPTAVGVTSGSFTAVNLSANPTTTNVFAFTSWTTSTTPDLSKYFELVLTPQNSYFIELSTMSFYTTRSNSGPQKWCVRTNLDSYAANAIGSTSLISPTSSGSIITVNAANEFVWGTIPTNSATSSSAWRNNCQVSFANATNIASPVNIRLYAFHAPANGGSYRIDSVVVKGTATFSVGAGLNKISHDLNASFKLYPNPSKDGIVYLEPKNADKASIEVFNILGEVVAKEEKESAVAKVKLNLSDLKVGTYFVRYTYQNKMHTEKLIISE